jgi:CubicO group peptidase (beta-lactamase class C family)
MISIYTGVIDEIANKYINEDYFKGVNIIITRQNDVIFEKSYGYAEYKPNKVKLERDFIFDIASVTKVFTTTAILRLISESRLKLSDKLVDLINLDNSRLRKTLKKISIKDLLTHGSGLIPWFPFYTRKEDDFQDILEDIIKENPLQKIVQYSDLNYILLGKIIEKKTEMNLKQAMEELVFEPLNLTNTNYEPAHDKIVSTEFGNKIEAGMVKEINYKFEGFRKAGIPIRGKVNDGNCFYYFEGVSGHAGIFSDLNDLGTLCNLYQNKGIYRGQAFLNEKLVVGSFQNYGHGRGLGWQISELYPDGVGHTGFTGTSIYLNLKKKFNVVILTNRLHVDNPVNINDFRKSIHLVLHNIIK